MTTPAAPRWPSLSVERAAPGASDGDDVDDDAWVSFAEDAAVRARDDAETAVRDAEFERALERVREAKRERARAQARKATARSAFLEDDARSERAREDEDEEDGGDVARGWRGEYAARDGDPAPAPRTLPQAWTAPKLNLNVDDEDVETFAREAATRATWASEAAAAATRESDAVAELTQHVRRLSSALSACERRESAAEAAATAEAERAAATEHEYLQMKARLKARDLDIGELNQVVFALKRRVDELTDALDEARRDGEKYRMEIAELKVNDSELRRTVEKRAVSERMAYNANEHTKRDILALQSKCRTLEEENGRLSERLAQSEDRGFEASKSAQRFHQLAEASARENEILQRANDAAANENARLNQELRELHKEVRAAHTQTSCRSSKRERGRCVRTATRADARTVGTSLGAAGGTAQNLGAYGYTNRCADEADFRTAGGSESKRTSDGYSRANASITRSTSDECEKGVDSFTTCRASTRPNPNRRRGAPRLLSLDPANATSLPPSHWSVR